MASRIPYLIVGQGVAGSLVAWFLASRRQDFRVLDVHRPGAASTASGGLVNPLAGKKFPPAWNMAQTAPVARHTYATIERALGRQIWYESPMLRLLRSAEQVEALAQRQQDPEAQPFIGTVYPAGQWGSQVDDAHGSFLTRDSGWVHFAALIPGIRGWLQAQGKLIEGTYNDGWLEDAETVIFCEGWRASENPLWQFIDWRPDRGELVTLRIKDARLPPYIINGGHWVRPLANGLWRAGANHAWRDFEAPPSAEGAQEVVAGVWSWLRAEMEVVDQGCGVRPSVADTRPVVGRHPEHVNLYILNGLGGKGALPAPWLARQLVAHLIEEAPLPPEFAPRRYTAR